MSACNSCSKEQTTKQLQPIGRQVTIATSVGRGHDQTDFAFAQCEKCGSVWVKYVDSGAGGHGTFWKRLTAGLF
ncbi:hypothetical protein Bsp3421_000156 (plasmid) [Burkholderia sp. FERM BP-3421]|uniref:hypothetical protein n=1 Tax=Burkholderia sp. FERM BP-3421 TaxID=1494466 RepID=UPI0023627BF1|nr:hypothetical protein [Burkholderia sp. FERM BP-3421]WDD90331.1 hypothetical protein Bsp3421_000156 [Burkholderia sp. FERM BP-3421]